MQLKQINHKHIKKKLCQKGKQTVLDMGNKKVNIEHVPTNIRHIMQFLKQFNTCDMYFTLSSY
jgi:hypothetical protein